MRSNKDNGNSLSLVDSRNKNKILIDKIVHILFLIIGMICASSIIIIVFFITIKGLRPFFAAYDNGEKGDFGSFLFGIEFIKGQYGVLGLVINTIFIVSIASLIALPLSVLCALFIVRIAPKKIRSIMEIVVDLLSAVPSIVFGLFGMGVINPLVKNIAALFNYQTAGGVSTLSVIIVLTIMIIPTITTVSITAMKSVKEDKVLGSLALGATKMQTNFNIILKGSKSGIIAGLILGVGRALGEATAVNMVCGGASGIKISLFDPTSTLTSAMMSGIHESSGLDYDIRFSVGLVLIIIILITNLILNIVKKRICKYDK